MGRRLVVTGWLGARENQQMRSGALDRVAAIIGS
jgi:hypothetical protein